MYDLATILQRTDDLVATYGWRDEQYANNYAAFKGEYDKIIGYEMRADSLTGKDTRNRRDQSFQVWNLMKPIVLTSTLQLARLPEIMVPAPIKGDPIAAAFADKQEKALYALWNLNNMGVKHSHMAFNLSCFGSSVTYVRPDEEAKRPVILVRRPELCYPQPKGEMNREFAYVSFRWEEDEASVYAEFPDMRGKVSPRPGHGRRLQVIEYIDDEDYVVIVEKQMAKHITHDFGFVPVTVTTALDTGDVFGPADIDQLVSINIYLNALQTKLSDALEDNLYPTTFLIGGEQRPINTGPGAFNWLDEGTQVNRLDPARIPPELWDQVLRVEDFMRTHAIWPEVVSGEMDASIVTGKAIQRLQGTTAGLAALRQLYMATDLQKINEYMFRIMEKLWPSKKYSLHSMNYYGPLSPPGAQNPFTIEFLPKEDIKKYYVNECMYSVFGLDVNASVVAGLQMEERGLVSKRYLRNQLPGLRDAEGMRLEIQEEKREEMDFEVELQQRLAQVQMGIEAQMQQAAAMQQGLAAPAGAAPGPEGAAPAGPPQGLPPGAAPPGGTTNVLPPQLSLLPGGQPQAMGIGEPLAGEENFPLPFEELKPYGAAVDKLTPEVPVGQPAAAETTIEPDAVTVEQITEELAQVDKLKGQVYIVGRMAEKGFTTGKIELGLTDPKDKQTIINALPQYYGRFSFMIVEEPPPDAIPVVMNQMPANQAVA